MTYGTTTYQELPKEEEKEEGSLWSLEFFAVFFLRTPGYFQLLLGSFWMPQRPSQVSWRPFCSVQGPSRSIGGPSGSFGALQVPWRPFLPLSPRRGSLGSIWVPPGSLLGSTAATKAVLADSEALSAPSGALSAASEVLQAFLGHFHLPPRPSYFGTLTVVAFFCSPR